MTYVAQVSVLETLQDLRDRERDVALGEVVADVVEAVRHRVAHVLADLLDDVLAELTARQVALQVVGDLLAGVALEAVQLRVRDLASGHD